MEGKQIVQYGKLDQIEEDITREDAVGTGLTSTKLIIEASIELEDNFTQTDEIDS